jgi:integrase
MSRAKRIPVYSLHKASGQAKVRIDGRDHYLGPHGSPESHARYDALVAELLEKRSHGGACGPTKTLTALLALWWAECKRRYGRRGKGPFGNAVCWRPTIRLLRESCGSEPAESLGPKRLREIIEDEAAQRDWSLRYCRDVLSRVRAIYKWACSEELIDVRSYDRLRTIELRHGRQSTPLGPVDDETIERTLPLLRPRIRAMVMLQRLTGMRPSELVSMRVSEVDRAGDVWVYRPASHKTRHRGKQRKIFIGPQGQAVLAPHLLKAMDFVFPAAGRGGAPYTSDSYRRAIQRTCQRHNIPRWSPYQLRKSAATAVRAELDVEAAAALLGHSSSQVTQDHYAALVESRAIAAAKLLG